MRLSSTIIYLEKIIMRPYFLSTVIGLFALLTAFQTPVLAQNDTKLTQTSGKYSVELRIPPEGIFAEEETDLHVRISDSSQIDPVQGAAPVIKAVLQPVLTMPAMASMAKQIPKSHTEGIPGEYGVVLYCVHGGDFQLDLTVTPPGEKAFKVAFTLPVKDAQIAKNRKLKPKPFVLNVKTEPASVVSGATTGLKMQILSRETKAPVILFDTVHERKFHFIVVSKDLTYFDHTHPETGENGVFTINYTFPKGGEYRLFADVAPHDAGSQYLMQALQVKGGSASASTPLKLSSGATVEGVKMSLTPVKTGLAAGKTYSLVFKINDAKDGSPVKDLEPYLGAMAHLILIHQDAATFVHSHPDESDPANGHNGAITVLARFPKAGLFKGWLQVQRAGKVITLPFVVEVKK